VALALATVPRLVRVAPPTVSPLTSPNEVNAEFGITNVSPSALLASLAVMVNGAGVMFARVVLDPALPATAVT